MKKYAELILVIISMGTGFAFMFTTFATAADMDDLKAIVIAEGIQRKMWRVCESSSDTKQVKRQIAKDQARYQQLTGFQQEWICTP